MSAPNSETLTSPPCLAEDVENTLGVVLVVLVVLEQQVSNLNRGGWGGGLSGRGKGWQRGAGLGISDVDSPDPSSGPGQESGSAVRYILTNTHKNIHTLSIPSPICCVCVQSSVDLQDIW